MGGRIQNYIILMEEKMNTEANKTIDFEKKLKEKLGKIHASGICLEQEEYEEGVVNIAVPIYKYTGRPIAAICVSIPVQRAQEELLNKMTEKLKKISREISSLPL